MSDAPDLGYLLTAYADGALTADGAAWVEAQLAERPDLRERLDEIRALQQRLRRDLPAAPTSLDDRRRAALLAGAANPARSPFMPWTVVYRLAAACLVVGVLWVSTRGTDAEPVRSARVGNAFSVTGLDRHEQHLHHQEEAGRNSFRFKKSDLADEDPPPVEFYSRHQAPGAAGRESAPDSQNRATPARRQLPDAKQNPASPAASAAPRPAVPAAPLTVTAAPPPPSSRPTPAAKELPALRAYQEAEVDRLAEPEALSRLGRFVDMPESAESPLTELDAAEEKAILERSDSFAGPTLPLPAIVAPAKPQELAKGLEERHEPLAKRESGAKAKNADPAAKPVPVAGDEGLYFAIGAGAGIETAVAKGPRWNQPAQPATTTTPSSGARGFDDMRRSLPLGDVDGRLGGTRDGEADGAPAGRADGDGSTFRGRLWFAGDAAGRDGADDLAVTLDTAVAESPRPLDPRPASPADRDQLQAARQVAQPGWAMRGSQLARPGVDPRETAATLGTRSGLASDGTLGTVLDTLPDLPLHVDPAAAPALGRRVSIGATERSIGQRLLQAVRTAGLQLRLAGGVVEVDARRVPLDPTDDAGLGRAAFRAAFGTTPMTAVAEDARHTFALDADTASFARARAALLAGAPVDAASIQVEHFVNAMPMDYPPATGEEAFTLYAEAGPSPFAAGALAPRTALVAVGVVSRPAAPDERRPLHLTLAIDCSGSMAQPGGLQRIRTGLAELIGNLRDDDRVALVSFGDSARVVLPATPGSERGRILAALDGLSAGGSTNCAEGLGLAYQLAAETVGTDPGAAQAESRVLLATDGATLTGEGAVPVLARIAEYRQRGISLLVVGCGDTPYESAALEQLADRGDGQHVFLGSDDEARQVFAERLLPERLQVLARDAKVQVTWNRARVSHARLVGYEQRRLAHREFRDDAVDAGEIGNDVQVTALFEVVLEDGGTGPLGSAAVRYHDTRLRQVRELPCPLPGAILATRASPRLRLLACAAEFGDLLQQGWWSNVRCSTWARLTAELARCPSGPARDDLLRLAQRAAKAAHE